MNWAVSDSDDDDDCEPQRKRIRISPYMTFPNVVPNLLKEIDAIEQNFTNTYINVIHEDWFEFFGSLANNPQIKKLQPYFENPDIFKILSFTQKPLKETHFYFLYAKDHPSVQEPHHFVAPLAPITKGRTVYQKEWIIFWELLLRYVLQEFSLPTHPKMFLCGVKSTAVKLNGKLRLRKPIDEPPSVLINM